MSADTPGPPVSHSGSAPNPHSGATIDRAGADIGHARLALVLVCEGALDRSQMQSFAAKLCPPDVASFVVAPLVPAWLPCPFLAPIAANEPHLSSALDVLRGLLDELSEGGIPRENVVVAGLGDGGALALECAARDGGRYHGVVGMSGALVGTAEWPGGFPLAELHGHRDKTFFYGTDLASTTVVLSARESDRLLPQKRFKDTAQVFLNLGADVWTYVEPGGGHAIMQHDIHWLRGLLAPS